MVRRYTVTVAGKPRAVELEELEGGRVRVSVDGRERSLEAPPAGGGVVSWLDGTRVVHAIVDGRLPKVTVTLREATMEVAIADARSQALAAVVRDRPRTAGPITVRAPIPGRVAKILVKLGEAISAGRGLAVVEAMKMENEIRAARDGTVREIRCAEGAAVDANQELFVID